MKQYIIILCFITFALYGCIGSSGSSENIEGKWSGTIEVDSNSTDYFEWVITYENYVPKLTDEGSGENFSVVGSVSDNIVSFSWDQGNIYDDDYNITGKHPTAYLTAIVEDGGSFMEGTIYSGNPLEAKPFTASRQPSSASTSAFISNIYSRAEDSKYTSTCDSYATLSNQGDSSSTSSDSGTVTIGDYNCETTNNTVAGNNLLTNVKILKHPVDSSVLFAGVLLDGTTFKDSHVMVRSDAGRGSGTFYLTDISPIDPKANSYTTDGPVTQTSVDLARNTLVQNISASTAVFQSTAYEADSKTSLAVDLNLGFESDAVNANVDVSYDKNTAVNYASYFAYQVYYTINFADPADQDNGGAFDRKLFFSSNTDTCSYFTDTDNPLVYLSSVSYGRMVLAVAESTYSSEDIKAAIEASATTSIGSATVASGATVSEVMSNTTITYYVYGGSGSAQARSISPTDNTDMVAAWYNIISDEKSAEYSSTNPGTPIMYTMKNIANHTVVNLDYAVNFDSRTCAPKPPAPPVSYSYKVYLDNTDDDVYICLDGQEMHKRGYSNSHITYTDFNSSMTADVDSNLSYTVGNRGCGKTGAIMRLYRKGSNQSSWHRIWHRNFSEKHPWTCGWQYQKELTVNNNGSYNKQKDPKYEGDIWSKGASGKCAN